MGSAPGNLDRRAPCYGVADLRIGASIDVHGRIFFLHDCDEFTRRCAAAHLTRNFLQPVPCGTAQRGSFLCCYEDGPRLPA